MTPPDEATVEEVIGESSGRRGPAPVKTTKVAVWLLERLIARGQPEAIAYITDAAGEAGLIRRNSKDPEKWNQSLLYATD